MSRHRPSRGPRSAVLPAETGGRPGAGRGAAVGRRRCLGVPGTGHVVLAHVQKHSQVRDAVPASPASPGRVLGRALGRARRRSTADTSGLS